MNQLQKQWTTSCKNCIFQIQNTNGMQIGCHGQDVSNEELFDYTTPDFHFVHKICQYKRDGDWRARIGKNNSNELWQVARKECKIKYSAIAEFKTAAEATQFFNTCLNQSLEPENVFACFRDSKEYQEFINLNKTKNKRWNSVFIPDDADTIYKIVIPLVKTHFMWFANPKKPLSNLFFGWLNEQINDNNFRFVCLTGESHIFLAKRVYDLSTAPLLELVNNIQEGKYDIISLSELANRNRPWTSQCSNPKESCGGCGCR